MQIRIISYNVNGLRSAASKGFQDWLATENPDIVCLQEIKIQEDQLEQNGFDFPGYHQNWSFAIKKGYSGTAVLSRLKPDSVSRGIGISKFDEEGRILRLDIGELTLINSYFPSGTTGDERQAFKMEYLDAFRHYIDSIRKTRDQIVVCGDFNIAHKPVDINHPGRHLKTSGFLPEERAWMDALTGSGLIDTFRVFNNRPEQYSWWSYRAGSRKKNLGWRIDYHFITPSLEPKLLNAGIMQEIVHSDHCPVFIDLNL